MSSCPFTVIEEKSMPDFKASKDRLALLLGANAVGDFNLKPMFIYHSENRRALKNYGKSILPMLYKWNNKTWVIAYLFATRFPEHLKPTVKTYCSEKNISFKILLFIYSIPGYPRALMEMYNGVNVVVITDNIISNMQLTDQGIILIL